MGLLYEVYTLPWDSSGFKKKFFWLPVEEGSGTGTIEFLTSSGEGSVTVLLDKLDEAGRDLTEIVSDTTSSLIRVSDCLPDGTKTIIDEWVCERPARVHDDERKVTISGPKLKAKAFDGQVIPAFDSPANPTVNPDHVWGGENILSDPGYENANKQNEEYEIDLDGATGGDFVLHLDGNPTNSIPFDTSVSNLESEVEALPGVTDVLVDEIGKGFRIEFHNPISPEREGLGLLTWTPSLTGTDNNEESLDRTNDGQILPSASWTRSQYSDASSDPNSHGTYASDGYRLTEGSEPVRSGEFAGRINGLTQFAGIQQLIRVQPSTRHQASIWFYSSDGTEEFRLVMRDRYENLIAWQNIENLTPDTWTEVTLDFVTELAVDGTPVSEMIFRFAQIIDHNPSPFYVDDAALRPGAPITTWGEIVNTLMALKTSEFDWIDHSTVTDTLDSGGVAWPRDESVTAFFGESYGQFWDKGVDLEYEWDLKPKDAPSGSLTHDLVWYGPGGLDTTPSAGIYPNASITGGDSLTRTPAFNKVIVEGAEGRYVEVEDAASVADIGPLEKHVKDTSLHSDASLTARANGLLTYEAANRNAVHFQMVEHKTLPRPGTHFKPGDTIPMQLPPGLEKTSKRVQSFSYTNSFPTQYLVTGSRVLSGEAAAYSLLWRLWRRFENPVRDKGGGGFAAGGGVGAIDVAAADAPEWEKAIARYQCDGVDDHIEIMAALSEQNYYSQCDLSSGNFYVPEGWVGFSGQTLRGQGSAATIIHNQGVGHEEDQPSPFNDAWLISLGSDAELSDVGFITTNDFVGTIIMQNYGYAHNIAHHSGNAQRFIYARGTIRPMSHIQSWADYDDVTSVKAMIEFAEGWYTLDNLFANIRGPALLLDRFGIASISGASIQITTDHPGIVVDNTGYLTMGDIALLGPTGSTSAGIEVRSYPWGFQMSNIVVNGFGYGLTIGGTFNGIDGMDIDNFWVSPRISGMDIDLGSTSSQDAETGDMMIRGYRCVGSTYGATGWGLRLNVALNTDSVLISDFDIRDMDEEGILLHQYEGGFNPPVHTSIIHDGIIKNVGKHGVLLERINAQVHDVVIDGAGEAAANTYDAFHLVGIMEKPRIQNNTILKPSQLRYGINISDSSVKQAIVTGNAGEDAGGFGTDAINDQGTETQLTFPSDPTYGDNFFTHTPQDLIKVEGETVQTPETDIHIPHLIVKVEDEVANISESDLHFLA